MLELKPNTLVAFSLLGCVVGQCGWVVRVAL